MGSALAYPDDGYAANLRMVHRFFRRDKNGQPIPDTFVEFLVLDWMLESGVPGRLALRLVAQRMGWTAG